MTYTDITNLSFPENSCEYFLQKAIGKLACIKNAEGIYTYPDPYLVKLDEIKNPKEHGEVRRGYLNPQTPIMFHRLLATENKLEYLSPGWEEVWVYEAIYLDKEKIKTVFLGFNHLSRLYFYDKETNDWNTQLWEY